MLAMVIVATMGLSSVAFAAENAAATTTKTEAPAFHKHQKHHGMHQKKTSVTPAKTGSAATEQKAQAAKKHHKKAIKPVEQKAQAAKKPHKKVTKK